MDLRTAVDLRQRRHVLDFGPDVLRRGRPGLLVPARCLGRPVVEEAIQEVYNRAAAGDGASDRSIDDTADDSAEAE